MVAYDYANNFIEAMEVSNLKDETILAAVQNIFNKMEENGHTPRLNVTDNQTVLNFWGVRTTKEYHSQESQVAVSKV